MRSMRALLADLGIGIRRPSFHFRFQSSRDMLGAVWSSYSSCRKDGNLAPLYVRKCKSHTVRIYHFQCYVIKEYVGATSQLASELAVLQQLHHESLISYVFTVDEGARFSVVMDWAGQGLKDLVELQQPLGEDVARYIAFQLTDSLVYLHSKGIIHRDIKPDNIGVQPDYTVKLFDWGEALLLDQLSSLTDKQLAKSAGIAGTPLYMPPEALLYLTKKGSTSSGSRGSTSSGCRSNDASSSTSKGCGQCGCCCWVATSSAHEHHQQQGTLRALTSPKLDVWGLGAVVYLLLAGKDILDSSYNLEDMAEILSASSGISLPAEVQASPAARDFVARVLEQDPAKRACARELLSHPWLSGLSAVRAKRAAALSSSKGPALSLSLQRSSSAQAMAYVIAAHRGGTRDSSSVPDTPVSGAEALSDSYE